MDHATQVALLHRIFRLMDERSTDLGDAAYVNPVSAYTSTARFAREREALLREPIFVGLSGDAATPGDWFTDDRSGVPMLIVRTTSGTLNAFIGVCRHRGARVADGAGHSESGFRCPYHGWTYDESGRLVGLPMAAGFADLPSDDLCLRRLPVAEGHGLIFVRPVGGAPIDIDAHLGGAERELAPFGLARYARFARHTTRRALNWKLVVDTFLEAYHVPSLHARSIGPTIFGAPAVWDGFGRSGRLLAVRRSVVDLRARPEAEWNLLDHAVILYLLFPNTVLIHQLDHVEVVRAYPDDVDATTIDFSLYTPEPATDERAQRHFQSNFDLLVNVSEQEDFRIGERMQRDFNAPGSDRVVYGRNEPGVAHFHRVVERAFGTDDRASRRG